MNCMKCGKQIPDTQVFCDDCIAVMDKYPVKIDTAVHIPKRETRITEKKPSRKKELSPEQLQHQQKKLFRWMLLTIFVLTGIVCLLGWLLLEAYGGNFSLAELF